MFFFSLKFMEKKAAMHTMSSSRRNASDNACAKEKVKAGSKEKQCRAKYILTFWLPQYRCHSNSKLIYMWIYKQFLFPFNFEHYSNITAFDVQSILYPLSHSLQTFRAYFFLFRFASGIPCFIVGIVMLLW